MKTKAVNNENNDSESILRLLQIAAGLASLIGFIGLLALLTQSSWAQSDKPGFPPGARSFGGGSNPFGNPNIAPGTPPPGGVPRNFFDDEEEEDLDFPPDDRVPPMPYNPPSGGGPGGGTAPSTPGPGLGSGLGGNPTVSNRGITIGGSPPSGVVSHGTQVKPMQIDDETGLGPGGKEIITDFNFPDADILDIAKALGKLTGKNFILDKDVKGRITVISNSKITVSDAWKAFLTALDMNGFALIPSGKYIRIARNRDARDKQIKLYTGEHSPDSDALITRIFPLKYISAEDVVRTFRQFLPANSRLYAYEQTNTVIVTDTGANISKLSKMLDILDVEGYDAGIEVIPVKYASATELSKLIDTLIPGTATAPGQPPGAPRFGGGRFNARRTKEGGIINTIISDERTNTLIVHANGKGADQVRELVAKLDQRVAAPTGGGKVHVVYLQYADAEQTATTLNNLSSGAGTKTAPPGAIGTGTGINPVATSLFEGSIKVSPDKSTNSLVITGTPADFVTVQRVINRLDIPRDEVYVETVIMEVAVNRAFDYSANIINPASGLSFAPQPKDIANFITNPASKGGFNFFFEKGSSRDVPGVPGLKIPGLAALVSFLQTNSNANILATPQIIALDNTEASFESSEKIPVPTTSAVQGVIQSGITKEPVSLTIKIKPQINKVLNFVKLDVDVKLGDIVNRKLPSAVENQAFATSERSAKTTVVVGDSDTVVLGGLMRDKTTETVAKVPLLGDIPILGWLFKSKSTDSQKTNLLIFLTPHIVRQYEKVREILDRKLRERDEFLESNTGGEDPLRKTRDNIIRSLPDIKDITTKRQNPSVTLDEEAPAAVPVSPDGNPFTGGSGPPAGGGQ